MMQGWENIERINFDPVTNEPILLSDDGTSESGISSSPGALSVLPDPERAENLRKKGETYKLQRFLRSQQKRQGESPGQASNSVPRIDGSSHGASSSSSSVPVNAGVNRSVGNSAPCAVGAACGGAGPDGTLSSVRLKLAKLDLNRNG